MVSRVKANHTVTRLQSPLLTQETLDNTNFERENDVANR